MSSDAHEGQERDHPAQNSVGHFPEGGGVSKRIITQGPRGHTASPRWHLRAMGKHHTVPVHQDRDQQTSEDTRLNRTSQEEASGDTEKHLELSKNQTQFVKMSEMQPEQ